jgi:DNA-binding CsgD family transcriptional regulator
VKLHNAAVKSLICKKAWERAGCFPFKWTYSEFEEVFLEQLSRLVPALQSDLEAVGKANGSADDEALYRARLALAQHVRSVVGDLRIAFAGAVPAQPSSSIIRKDHPARYFELLLADGRLHVGSPRLNHKDRFYSIDSNKICERLGLSQRQGQITGFLADGYALSAIATEMGMTLSTARWHLREVFKRTSCHSQSELIDLAKRAL